MGGQLGDEGSVHAEVSQGHGNVCFAAAEGELHMVALDKALVVIGLQTQHQFTKSNNLRHMILSPCNYVYEVGMLSVRSALLAPLGEPRVLAFIHLLPFIESLCSVGFGPPD